MPTLRDLVGDVAALPNDLTFYAQSPWSPEALAVAVQEGQAPTGFDYMLEVEVAREVVQVWSKWRDGRTPSPDEAAAAVIHYATFDTYLPVERD